MEMAGDVRIEFRMLLSGKTTMTADVKFVKVSRRRSSSSRRRSSKSRRRRRKRSRRMSEQD